MNLTLPIIDGLRVLAPRYGALICDIWGVVHNGIAIFEEARTALREYRAQGGFVLLLTNAPRPATQVREQLAHLEFDASAYDAVLTSGDVIRDWLAEKSTFGTKCHYVGPKKDATLLEGLELDYVGVHDADFILISGLDDDTTETPDDYQVQIATWRMAALTLLCSNSDRVVQRGDVFIYCAGAIAEAYENAGGKVVWGGKPHPTIYQRARQIIEAAHDDSPRILAIGDGPETDIRGANQAKIDVLFITNGIAQAENTTLNTPTQISKFLEKYQTQAQAAMPSLKW